MTTNKTTLKYLIIGAGGTGGCIGSYLARRGQDVTFIARGAYLEAMRSNGLSVDSSRIGDFTISPVKVCTMEEYEATGDTPDVIFLCVKYYSLKDCSSFINKVGDSTTLVIPILNVFGTGADIQKCCPKVTAIEGCIYIFSMIEAPGKICQPTPIFKVFAGFRDNQSKDLAPAVQQVIADLSDAGIDAHYSENIKRDALQKFSFVSPVGAAGLYYDAVGKDFMVPGKQRDTLVALIREVESLGSAMGITFETDLVETNLAILDGLTKDSTTSMQRDVAKGGLSEIDGLVHRIVRLAKEHEVPVPTYQIISQWAMEKNIH